MSVRARGLDRTATAAAEIATLRQKLAAAEARIREIEADIALAPESVVAFATAG